MPRMQMQTPKNPPPSKSEAVLNWIGGFLEKHLASGAARKAAEELGARRNEIESLLNTGEPMSDEEIMRNVEME